jgi:hypothetical protein
VALAVVLDWVALPMEQVVLEQHYKDFLVVLVQLTVVVGLITVAVAVAALDK